MTCVDPSVLSFSLSLHRHPYVKDLTVSFNSQDQAPDDPSYVQDSQCDPCDLLWIIRSLILYACDFHECRSRYLALHHSATRRHKSRLRRVLSCRAHAKSRAEILRRTNLRLRQPVWKVELKKS